MQVDENTSTVMLDTSGGAWITPAPGTLSGEDVTRRCRHAVTSVGPFVFIYGGLKGSTLLDDLLLAGGCAVSNDASGLSLLQQHQVLSACTAVPLCPVI